MRKILLTMAFNLLMASFAQAQNEFYFNGLADIIFRYPPRGSGGRALVHGDGNALSLNYGSDFTGGTRIGNDVFFKDGGDSYIYSGKFGIGTSTPDAPLTVFGTSRFYPAMANASDVRSFSIGNSMLNHSFISNSYPVVLSTGNGDQPLILDASRIGIGTTSPEETMELKAMRPIFSYHNPGIATYKVGITSTGVFKIAGMDNAFGGHVGDFESNISQSFAINKSGNVGIGTITPTEKLSVNGKIRAKEIKVEADNWPDYVFEPEHKSLTLKEIEACIKANKHLPEIPSAKEVEANGVSLGEMNKLLLKKIEELTLHLIKNEKETRREKEGRAVQSKRLLRMEREFEAFKKEQLKLMKRE